MKLIRKDAHLEAVQITANFGIDQSDWPDWLKRAWRAEQPMADGTIPAGMVVPDIGNDIRVGGPVCPEIGRLGDYIIRNKEGHLGAATPGLLFNLYEPDLEPVAEEVAPKRRKRS